VYVEGEENCKSGFLIDYTWIDQYKDRNYPSLMYEIYGDYTNLDYVYKWTKFKLCQSYTDTPSLDYKRTLQGNDRFRNIETIRNCFYQGIGTVEIITENITNSCDFPIIHTKSDPALFEIRDGEWCPTEKEEERKDIQFKIKNIGTQNLVFFDMFIDGPQKSLFSFGWQVPGYGCDKNTILRPGGICWVDIEASCHNPQISDVSKNVLVIDTNDGNPLRRRTLLPLEIKYAGVLHGYGPQFFFLLFY
jgi:hypothetical protein